MPKIMPEEHYVAILHGEHDVYVISGSTKLLECARDAVAGVKSVLEDPEDDLHEEFLHGNLAIYKRHTNLSKDIDETNLNIQN